MASGSTWKIILIYSYIEDSGALESMGSLKRYFDYKSFAHDLEIELSFVEYEGDYYLFDN